MTVLLLLAWLSLLTSLSVSLQCSLKSRVNHKHPSLLPLLAQRKAAAASAATPHLSNDKWLPRPEEGFCTVLVPCLVSPFTNTLHCSLCLLRGRLLQRPLPPLICPTTNGSPAQSRRKASALSWFRASSVRRRVWSLPSLGGNHKHPEHGSLVQRKASVTCCREQ
jgi:hypothetical protein